MSDASEELVMDMCVKVQEIVGNAISAAILISSRETSPRATITFALPALCKAVGSLLATCDNDQGIEDGLQLCMIEIKDSIKYAQEQILKVTIQ
jgi:hypothetical protein